MVTSLRLFEINIKSNFYLFQSFICQNRNMIKHNKTKNMININTERQVIIDNHRYRKGKMLEYLTQIEFLVETSKEKITKRVTYG